MHLPEGASTLAPMGVPSVNPSVPRMPLFGLAAAMICAYAARGCQPTGPTGTLADDVGANGAGVSSSVEEDAAGDDLVEGEADRTEGDAGAGAGAETETGAAPAENAAGTAEEDGGPGAEPTTASSHGSPVGPELIGLLDELEGWATGTTGGAGGTVFVVDSLAEEGPRSLRAALTSDEAYWIVFAEGLEGVIQLSSTIYARSNKTVDGRGHNIQLRGDQQTTAIRIEGQSNLIFTHLRFDDESADWDQDSEGADGITIVNSSLLWIHHCRFSRWRDGGIDMRHNPALPGGPPDRISVTHSRFDRLYQGLNWTAGRVSFGRSYCYRVRARCVKIIGGYVHSYNNVIEDWGGPEIQCAKDNGQMFSQANIFLPGDLSTLVNKRENGGKIENHGHSTVGAVEFVGGSDLVEEEWVSSSQALVSVDTCAPDDSGCWNALRTQIVGEAGVFP